MQIIEIIRKHENGLGIPHLCREYGVSRSTFYAWRAKYAGSEGLSSELRRTSMLEDENHRLKRLLGDVVLENSALKQQLKKIADQ
jgi:putative transposase